MSEAFSVWEQTRRLLGASPPGLPAADLAPSPAPAPDAGYLGRLQADADRVLASARTEAQRLLGEAEASVEARLSAAETEAQQVLSRALSGLLEQFEASFDARLADLRRDLPTLLVDMAERVLGRKLAEDDALVVEVVARALEQVAGARRVQLLLHPDDEPVVRAAQERLLAGLEDASLKLTASDQVERGGVILRTDRGEVDGRIRVQLERLGEVLREAVEEAPYAHGRAA